jgi:hypothetical protein
MCFYMLHYAPSCCDLLSLCSAAVCSLLQTAKSVCLYLSQLVFKAVLASTAFANAEYYGFGRSDSANSGFLSMEKNKILIQYIFMYIKIMYIL